MLGGKAPANFRWNSATARAYCSPRKTSSASFSRCIACRHTGSATESITLITASATSSAAIA